MVAIFRSTFVLVILISVILGGAILIAKAPTKENLNKPVLDSNDFSVTIGWVGDMVPTLNTSYNQNVFSNVISELQRPDLMIGNLEGTFASIERKSKCLYMSSMCHAFRGDASFALSLKLAGFDFVSLVNNHAFDYGEDGLKDTEQELDRIGLPFISYTKPSTSVEIDGKKIGILGLSSTKPAQTILDYDFIKKEVSLLKENNNFVIVIFHGGAEGPDKTSVPGTNEYVGTEDRGNVELVAHTAIDAGANLVLGAGPHVLRKIEVYKGVPIAYSLGNFVGGNQRLVTTGTLALSGIFTATLKDSKPTLYNFISVILSRNGVPSIDSLGQSGQLIQSLSK